MCAPRITLQLKLGAPAENCGQRPGQEHGHIARSSVPHPMSVICGKRSIENTLRKLSSFPTDSGVRPSSQKHVCGWVARGKRRLVQRDLPAEGSRNPGGVVRQWAGQSPLCRRAARSLCPLRHERRYYAYAILPPWYIGMEPSV
ncbi:hypothetical protein ACJJTC_001246 [Scirpophaga incertulas]